MQRLTYAAMKALVQSKISGSDPQTFIIDVRSADEVAGGAIPTSVNVPLDQLEEALKLTTDDFAEKYASPKPIPSNRIVTYCLRGKRAENAAGIFQSHAYSDVDVYPGSWAEWSENESAK